MNGKDLLKGLNFIDEQLIEDAEQNSIKGKTEFIKLLIPIVASFAVIIMIFPLWISHKNISPILPDNDILPLASEETHNHNKEYILYFNKADSQIAANLSIKGHFWENLSSKQASKILPNIFDQFQVEGTINYSHTDGNTIISSINTTIKVEEKKDVKITIAPNKVVKCYMIDGEPILSKIENVDIEAGIFKTDKNSKGRSNYIYYADFKIEDIAYYVEFTGKKNDKTFFTNIVADIILGGKADLSIFDNPTIPELRDDRLTETEAYAEMDFGKYLLKIPNNYQFNDAVRFINQNSNYLFASWSQGYDDIRITISNLKEEDKKRIISVNDTELYDMSLYPIPWADSMPRDKAYIIENPIFIVEELTLNAIKMREYTRNDIGDTNNVSIRFSVLYHNVVVEVSTEGVSSEYLFKELTSLPQD